MVEVAILPLVGSVVIFVLGLAGSLAPPLISVYLPQFDMNTNVFFRLFNGIAAGVVLAVGYVHSIPEGFNAFRDAQTGDSLAETYGWGGLCAMIGSLITFAVEEFVHRRIGRFANIHGYHGESHQHDSAHSTKPKDSHETLTSENAAIIPTSTDNNYGTTTDNGDYGMAENGGTKQDPPEASAEHYSVHNVQHSSDARYYSELYVLLVGLSFHSFFVGMSLGVADSDYGLFIAIIFHQFFEGLALGARVARAQFKSQLHVWFLDLVYAAATPIGVAVGIGIHELTEDDPTAFGYVNGTFQSLSGGILIYVALIHMMKEEVERPEFNKGGAIMWALHSGFIIGAAAMAVIGIWA